MKKVIAIILLVIATLTPIIAVCEDVPLSELSLNELFLKRQDIDNEIHQRITPDGEILVNPGTYTCGVDIAAGSYELTAYLYNYSSRVLVYESKEDRYSYYDPNNYNITMKLNYTFTKSDAATRVFISLEEGNVMVIKSGALYTIKKAGLFFD